MEDGQVVVGSLVGEELPEHGDEMKVRKKHVFRDDEEERSRVRRNLSRAMSSSTHDSIYDYEVDWYGYWGNWESLFPTQQEVLSAVEKAITQAENESVDH